MLSFNSGILAFIMLACTAVIQGAGQDGGDKSIDEMIMEANSRKSVEMLDLFQMMDGGKMMMMVELDMLMNTTELKNYRQKDTRQKRKALRFENSRWPNCNVPYEIDEFAFTSSEKEVIRGAATEWERYSCLKFREIRSSERNSFPDRIFFRNADGCYSRVGRVTGAQAIGLGRGCRQHGIVVHEIGHAIGWIHEQARPDRDEYITVNFNQIPRNWHPQYAKVSDRVVDDMGVEYDYTSIMHYSGRAFGAGTITTKDPAFQNRLGQRTGLSFRDIKVANLMYGCAQMSNCPTTRCPGEGFVDKNCQCQCPGPISNPLVPCATVTTSQPTRRPATTTTTTRRPPTTTTTPPTVCRDVITTCSTFQENGQCVTDKARMALYCKLTCDLCEEDMDKMCMDFDDACPVFANAGYCDEVGLSEFVTRTCPKSCKLCTPIPCSQQSDLRSDPNTGAIASVNKLCILLSVVLMMMGH